MYHPGANHPAYNGYPPNNPSGYPSGPPNGLPNPRGGAPQNPQSGPNPSQPVRNRQQ